MTRDSIGQWDTFPYLPMVCDLLWKRDSVLGIGSRAASILQLASLRRVVLHRDIRPQGEPERIDRFMERIGVARQIIAVASLGATPSPAFHHSPALSPASAA